jgi:hypothetical protein
MAPKSGGCNGLEHQLLRQLPHQQRPIQGTCQQDKLLTNNFNCFIITVHESTVRSVIVPVHRAQKLLTFHTINMTGFLRKIISTVRYKPFEMGKVYETGLQMHLYLHSSECEDTNLTTKHPTWN